MPNSAPHRRSSYRRTRHPVLQTLQKGIAVVALLDLGLVAFDASYIAMRDIYLATTPLLTQQYDQIKGITDHRETTAYLEQVRLLEAQLAKDGPQGETVEQLLQTLRDRSVTIIDDNPFQEANKTGTLEKIKNRMRRHLPLNDRPLNERSAKKAFQAFWSTTYLTPENWETELAWFNRRIAPPIASNYFRPYAENNQLVDYFWRIDLVFILFFGIDFLIRTFFLSRRRGDLNWLDAMIWRWYDLFLLLPFWRLLRIIPVSLRLHQAGLINLNRIQKQGNRFVAETIVGEVTELVMVRAIGVIQDAIDEGAIRNWLTAPVTKTVEINDVNEVEEIINQALRITTQRVLPTLQPDLEALVRHSLVSALTGMPLYDVLQNLPGVDQMPTVVAHQLVEQLTQTTAATVEQVLGDAKGRELFNQLSQNFTIALRKELQDQNTLDQLQSLLSDLLEETKLTLLQQLEEQAVERTVDEVHQLRQINQSTRKLPTVQVLRD